MKNVLGAALLFCSACGSDDAALSAAKAFQLGAEKCLLVVRDRGAKYESAPECFSLKVLSESYVDAGGQLPNENQQSAFVAETGRRMAWTARAISASGDPTISLW